MANDVHVLIVEADGAARFDRITPNAETIRGILGGWLEAIAPIDRDFGNWHAYVDEEGKIKNYPVNAVATQVAYSLGWPAGDYLCGAVVFLGPHPTDRHGEGDFPAEATAEVIKMFGGFVDGEDSSNDRR